VAVTDVIIARALHVLAVVIWIGGVSMATTVALPAVRRGDLGENRLQAFQAVEHRFVWQAQVAIVVVGLTGCYMAWRLDLWEWFRMVEFWWMHAMVCVWLLFAFRSVRGRAFHSAPPFRSLDHPPGMVDVLKPSEMRRTKMEGMIHGALPHRDCHYRAGSDSCSSLLGWLR